MHTEQWIYEEFSASAQLLHWVSSLEPFILLLILQSYFPCCRVVPSFLCSTFPSLSGFSDFCSSFLTPLVIVFQPWFFEVLCNELRVCPELPVVSGDSRPLGSEQLLYKTTELVRIQDGFVSHWIVWRGSGLIYNFNQQTNTFEFYCQIKQPAHGNFLND